MADKRFVPYRQPDGEVGAMAIYEVEGRWVRSDGQVVDPEVTGIYASEAAAIQAGRPRAKLKKW